MFDRCEVSKGSKIDLHASAYTITVGGGATDAAVDLMAVLLDSAGRVRSDNDLVFFNNTRVEGVALMSDQSISVSLTDVPADVHRVLIAATTEAQGKHFGQLPAVNVNIDGDSTDRITFQPPSLTNESVLQLVALYRRGGGWRLNSIGQGYAGGLASFATDFGVTVDTPDSATTQNAQSPSPPAPATPTVQSPPAHEKLDVGGGSFSGSIDSVNPNRAGIGTRTTDAASGASGPPKMQNTGENSARAGRLGGRRTALIVGSLICTVLLIVVIGRTGRTDSTTTTVSALPTTAFSTMPTLSTPTAPPPALPPSTSHEISPTPQPQPGDASTALATLATLPIKGRAPKTGYDRDQFGPAWTDDTTADSGHNGCDTRQDILRRDLVGVEITPGTNGCTVLAGVLNDPYTGTSVEFHRGRDTSTLIDVDHIVALSDAWQKGAQQWDADRRRAFANDPINLQATIGSVNRQKGDGDAATWLPPNKSYRCVYVSRIVNVKAVYGLWVTQAEHDAIAQLLTNCDGTVSTPAPSPPKETPFPSESVSEPVPPSSPPSPSVTGPTNGSSVYYPNCAAVKAAGAAPLHAGEPGYRSGLDRDGDGIACEK